MCGRLDYRLDPSDYSRYLGIQDFAFTPNDDVRPTDPLPVVREKRGSLEVVTLGWGFPIQGRPVLFNARSETVGQLPSFKEAYRYRRALVLVSSWYEWTQQGSKKQQQRIFRKDHKPLVLAGLWQGDRFTVLTEASKGWMEDYHHRMPTLLLKKDWEPWVHAGPAPEIGVYPLEVLAVEAVEK